MRVFVHCRQTGGGDGLHTFHEMLQIPRIGEYVMLPPAAYYTVTAVSYSLPPSAGHDVDLYAEEDPRAVTKLS